MTCKNCLQASQTALSSRNFMCILDSRGVHVPCAVCPFRWVPHPTVEASVINVFWGGDGEKGTHALESILHPGVWGSMTNLSIVCPLGRYISQSQACRQWRWSLTEAVIRTGHRVAQEDETWMNQLLWALSELTDWIVHPLESVLREVSSGPDRVLR